MMALVTVLVVSLATLRNWVASGRFVPITTSFSINFYLGNQPPPGVPVHTDALSSRFAIAIWFFISFPTPSLRSERTFRRAPLQQDSSTI